MGYVRAQNNIYLWYEIDPGWKTRALEFWHEVKGYGKKVPGEMCDLIGNYYSVSDKKLELTLQEEILKSMNSTPIQQQNSGRHSQSKNHQ